MGDDIPSVAPGGVILSEGPASAESAEIPAVEIKDRPEPMNDMFHSFEQLR